ncbi:tRNA pseudouridine(38-40) synthase TruA [Pigmentibacter sp. JX0631]|uniref:tRNA pseudouridine(38-40) synthase TruA n=1 Tax=Pigmentibacter sp. JX0631 TaxID=2976982 RepID=UPI0024691E23|nr:tRNA pseudouridine(38-40) synthase TruA [Pigmentibacter sp. JX0631]WGL59634.1 tRNA pseudouridine(38-40) synthase TruA [Pigmentibacter sp. JX0631]
MEEKEYQNFKLIFSWNGEKFHGYQQQPNVFTVQEAITKAWFILTKETVTLTGCSRLDAGVHANSFVLNLQSQTNYSLERIQKGLNGIFHSQLHLDISLYSVEHVASDFHARFSSQGKHYRYLIWYGFSEHAFLTRRCWHVRTKLDVSELFLQLQNFVGEHDFSAFRAIDCGAKNTIKKIYQIHAQFHPVYSECIVIDIWGEGFLKNMIRNMVGTAVDIASNKLSKNTITEGYLHKNRNLTGVCAPAWGLTLMQVFYSKKELEKALQLPTFFPAPC